MSLLFVGLQLDLLHYVHAYFFLERGGPKLYVVLQIWPHKRRGGITFFDLGLADAAQDAVGLLWCRVSLLTPVVCQVAFFKTAS